MSSRQVVYLTSLLTIMRVLKDLENELWKLGPVIAVQGLGAVNIMPIANVFLQYYVKIT